MTSPSAWLKANCSESSVRMVPARRRFQSRYRHAAANVRRSEFSWKYVNGAQAGCCGPQRNRTYFSGDDCLSRSDRARQRAARPSLAYAASAGTLFLAGSTEWKTSDAIAREILELHGAGSVSVTQKARELPYGSQKLLGIGMALATRPQLLLMDEPAAGLNPNETRALAGLFERLRGRGIDIVLVEHDVRLVMSVCDRILVLNYGQAIAVGSPDEIRNDPLVIEAYLGGADEIA